MIDVLHTDGEMERTGLVVRIMVMEEQCENVVAVRRVSDRVMTVALAS